MVICFNPLCKSHFLYLHVGNVTLLLTKNYFALKILYISPNFGTSKRYITFHWWQKLLLILLVLPECSVEWTKSQAKSKQGKNTKTKTHFYFCNLLFGYISIVLPFTYKERQSFWLCLSNSLLLSLRAKTWNIALSGLLLCK